LKNAATVAAGKRAPFVTKNDERLAGEQQPHMLRLSDLASVREHERISADDLNATTCWRTIENSTPKVVSSPVVSDQIPFGLADRKRA
jgi:hypothetical protein